MKETAPVTMPKTLIAALMGAVLALPAEAAEPEKARAVAEQLVEETHGALIAEDVTEDARAARLKSAVEAAFAFDIWERFLLQGREDALTEGQRAEFRDLLPGFLADLYATQFGKGLDRAPEIRETRAARKDVLVRAGIPRSGGRTLPVDWRIRDLGERGHRVIDVMVGGTSFLVTKRAEFQGLIDSGGAEALLAHMRENSL